MSPLRRASITCYVVAALVFSYPFLAEWYVSGLLARRTVEPGATLEWHFRSPVSGRYELRIDTEPIGGPGADPAQLVLDWTLADGDSVLRAGVDSVTWTRGSERQFLAYLPVTRFRRHDVRVRASGSAAAGSAALTFESPHTMTGLGLTCTLLAVVIGLIGDALRTLAKRRARSATP